MTSIDQLRRKVSGASELIGIDPVQLQFLKPTLVRFGKGDTIVAPSRKQRRLFLIESGWASSSMLLTNGTRQILDFLLPGDFVGLEVIAARSGITNVEAVTTVAAYAFDIDALCKFVKEHAEIQRVITWCLVQQASIICEHLCSVGRRSANQRIAHLLLELWCRVKHVEGTAANSIEVPLKLRDIADALGLSEVHVSRTIKRIRNAGAFGIDLAKHRITISNGLAGFHSADFDPAYLRLDLVDWSHHFYNSRLKISCTAHPALPAPGRVQ